MMRVNRMMQLIIILIFAVFATGCEQNDIEEQTYKGEYVEYSVELDCRPMSYGTATKAATDAESTEFVVKNLWYIQFDSNNKVVGQPTYIADYTADSKIKLVPISGGSNKIMFIANSFYSHLPVYVGMSFDEVAQLKQTITKHSDCYSEVDGCNYIQMCDLVDVEEGATEIPRVELYATVSKVEFNVTVDPGLGYKVAGVEMNGVCNALYFYCGYDESENFPLKNNFQVVSFEVAENENDGNFKFYLPINRRGVVDESTELTKPQFADSHSTFANIFLKNDEGNIVAYKFVLGADLIKDFNLSANKHYVYNIDFQTLGDPITDLRVSEAGGVDYTDYPSANCYILNPNVSSLVTYKIPVAERVNTFWNYYESVADNRISSSDSWYCEIIWSDAESLTNSDGEEISFTQDKADPLAMNIVVPKDFNHGNFLVGVKKPGQDKYLWSWHFWITDYNPNEFAKYQNLPDLPTFGVANGEVQKYSSKNYYFMDRNLGARSVLKSTTDKGELLYQFGRKDPLIPSALAFNTDPKCKVQSLVTSVNASMAMSVNDPAQFYSANKTSEKNKYDWQNSVSDEDRYKDVKSNWNDRLVNDFAKKSIFDPSPLGWRIPSSESIQDIKYQYCLGIFSVNNRGLYMCRKSEGSASLSNYNTYFPCLYVRYIAYDTGARGISSGTMIYTWINQPSSVASGYMLRTDAQSNYADMEVRMLLSSMYRAYALSIRPMFYPEDLVKGTSKSRN